MILARTPRRLDRALSHKFLWRNLWIPGDKLVRPGCARGSLGGARIGAGHCVDKCRETKALATSPDGHSSTIHRPTTTTEDRTKKNMKKKAREGQ